MFVDASAMVAILTLEPGHTNFARRLDAVSRPVTSPLSLFEAALAIERGQRLGLQRARALVEHFLQRSNVETLPITAETGSLALEGFERYGKGRNPARLNFGDCFAYAMAKQHGVPLLYTGDDFAQTDLA